jgi:hypothetical protein
LVPVPHSLSQPVAHAVAIQDAAGEKLTELPFDEERQPIATTTLARLGQKGLEMLADYTVQNGLLGLPGHVRTTCAPAPSCVHRLVSARRRPIGGDRLRLRHEPDARVTGDPRAEALLEAVYASL